MLHQPSKAKRENWNSRRHETRWKRKKNNNRSGKSPKNISLRANWVIRAIIFCVVIALRPRWLMTPQKQHKRLPKRVSNRRNWINTADYDTRTAELESLVFCVSQFRWFLIEFILFYLSSAWFASPSLWSNHENWREFPRKSTMNRRNFSGSRDSIRDAT